MNIFKKKPLDISLRDLCKIINKETLTQLEVAKKKKIGVRHVKRLTAQGKLNPITFKSTVLYIRGEIK